MYYPYFTHARMNDDYDSWMNYDYDSGMSDDYELCVNHYHTICDEHIINCDPWQNNSVNCTNCLTITIVSS